MKKTLFIIIQFASLGLVAQVSGLDLTVSGSMLIDPYLSSNDQVLIGQSVRDFSTGYSSLESNSLSVALEADYALFNKEWLHLHGRLSYGQLSASNEYQYYNSTLSSISVGAGVDVLRVFGLPIMEEFELQGYAETGLALYSSKMWFTLDNSLQNVVEGFSPLVVTGVQFKYSATDKFFLCVAPEVNYVVTDALDGWVDGDFATTYFGLKLGLGLSLD